MARSERAAFLGVLRQAEEQMTALFDQVAQQIAEVVLRAAGEDGKVPVERLRDVQGQVHQIVDRAMLGPGGRAFGEQHEPLSPYARVIAQGQQAMIDLALERQAKLLDRVMPADVRDAVRARYQGQGTA